jgi:BlaI family transcriptional regulator, penicillinase repressor
LRIDFFEEIRVHDVQSLTELQLTILQVLWDSDEATTQEIHSHLHQDRGLALTTVATLLSRLEKRGILEHRKDGRQYVYRALVTRPEVRRSKIRELTETLFEGDAAALISHLVRSDETGRGDLERIKALITRAEAGQDV